MARRIPPRNNGVSERQARRPGRFDRAVPGLVQEAFSGPGPLRVHAPARSGAPAAEQTATDQNRMGDRFHGMARRAEGSGLNRGARYWWFESTPRQRSAHS